MQIVKIPDPVLKVVCSDVIPDELDWWSQNIERMTDLMTVSGGVGLAASQVGLPKRLFIARIPDLAVFVNPVLTYDESAGMEFGMEGCLSIPGSSYSVARWKALRVEAVGLDGKPFTRDFTGFHARVIQHEYDHTIGILISDVGSPHVINPVVP